jgi:hypothetical protein
MGFLGVHTTVHHITLMEVIDGIEHLLDRLGSILFREFPAFADSIKQLSTCS